ncbi:MAG: DUF3386 family protein [Planctomycetes bacterium]|nr:DUF3386 family protein [Planctomycetota bacterium]
MRKLVFPALALLLALTGRASAHFLWLVPDAKTGRVEVYFAEAAEPDDPALFDRLKGLKIRHRTPDGKTSEANPERHEDSLAVKPKTLKGTFGLAHTYGLLKRGDDVFLLQYNAKAYTSADSGAWHDFEKKASPDLDVAARVENGQLVFEARWKGEPLSGAEIHFHPPSGDAQQAATDEAGRLIVPAKHPGLYAVRAKHVEDRAGRHGDKEFPQVRHYATLTLTLDSAAETEKVAAGSESAEELMRRAHEARAEWGEGFPGFEADVVVSQDDTRVKGRLSVSADGELTLTLAEGLKDEQAVRRRLESLVQHRQAGGEREYDVDFADESHSHPLGRLIRFNDDRLHSIYRVKGDVITEVHRTMGESRFTISVLDVSRNKQGKYLPHIYTVSFWDAKTGDLKDAFTTSNEWKAVGGFDLPSRILTVSTGNEAERHVDEIAIGNHKLLKQPAAAAAGR